MVAFTENDFRGYIAAFNRNDFEGFGAYYADDIVFGGRGGLFRNREDVLDFYRMVKRRIRHTITVRGLVLGERGLVADMETEMHALEDWPDFMSGPLRRGETVRSQSFVWYELEKGKFARIRSAHCRRLATDEVVTDVRVAPGQGMSVDRFSGYIDAFNRDDYAAFGDYYRDDVVLEVAGKHTLRGRQAIFDFYKTVKSCTRRVIQVNKLIPAGNQLAAELQSEFLALADAPDFAAGPMSKGGRMFINTFVLYELTDGKFSRIRSAELRKINRP